MYKGLSREAPQERCFLRCLIGNCVAFPIKQKALRVDRTASERNLSLRDPPQAENPAEQDSIFIEKDKLWELPDGVLPQFFSFRIFVLFVEPDECLRNTLLAEGKFC